MLFCLFKLDNLTFNLPDNIRILYLQEQLMHYCLVKEKAILIEFIKTITKSEYGKIISELLLK